MEAQMEASGTTTKEGDTDGIPKTGNRQRENSDESQWSGENEVQILPKTGGPKIKRKPVRREDILTGSSKKGYSALFPKNRDIRPNSGKSRRKSGREIRPRDVNIGRHRTALWEVRHLVHAGK